MRASPLLAELPPSAEVAEYRGALLAAQYPDERAAAFAAVALADWSWRARVLVSGPEARKWLNGIVSANVRDLRPGQATASFFLDPKGHVLDYFDLAALAADRFLILCEQSAAADLAMKLRRYLFRAQAEISDASDDGPSLALVGPEAAALLAAAGFTFPPAAGSWTETALADGGHGQIVRWSLGLAAEDGAGGLDTFELLPAAAATGGLWRALASRGGRPVGATLQEHARIVGGIPRPGQDLRPSDLASETGLLHAVGTSKGCYIGQEIVERVRARGAVHRQLRRMRFAGPVEAGAKIEAEGRTVGEVTSATPLGSCGGGAALASDAAPVGRGCGPASAAGNGGPRYSAALRVAAEWAALGYLRHEADEGGFTCLGQAGRLA